MPFDKAREFVRRLGLKNQLEYRQWVVGRLRRRALPPRPKNIPANPDQIYSGGWDGFNDFLGTAKARNVGRSWRPFREAREYVPLAGSSRRDARTVRHDERCGLRSDNAAPGR
jgi:hypothetical protein